MKNDTNIEWEIEEDEQAWRALQNVARTEESLQVETARKVVQRQEQHLAFLLVAITLLLGIGWFWQRQRATMHFANELQASLEADLPTPARKLITEGSNIQTLTGQIKPSHEQTNSTATSASTLGATIELESYQRTGNRLMAQVLVYRPVAGEQRAFRETRFYHKAADQWVRIDPDPTLLGPTRTLQLPHFVTHYKEVDASAVYQTAPQLEQLYATLANTFSAPAARASSVYTIEIITDEIPFGYNFSMRRQQLSVPSPTVLTIPVEMTPATILRQAIVYPLTRELILERVAQHDPQWRLVFSQWHSVENALRLWALWEDGGPLETGRVEIVRWAFDSKETKPIDAQPLPVDYEHICRTYQIWAVAPWDFMIPLGCISEEMNPLLAQHYATLPSATQQLLYPAKGKGFLAAAFTDTIMTESVIEYAVAHYGVERLPALIDAFGEHSVLDTLIPASFDTSAPEFEAGWLQYLSKRYGIVASE